MWSIEMPFEWLRSKNKMRMHCEWDGWNGWNGVDDRKACLKCNITFAYMQHLYFDDPSGLRSLQFQRACWVYFPTPLCRRRLWFVISVHLIVINSNAHCQMVENTICKNSLASEFIKCDLRASDGVKLHRLQVKSESNWDVIWYATDGDAIKLREKKWKWNRINLVVLHFEHTQQAT